MSITRIINRTVSLDGLLWRDNLPGLTYQGEQNAHVFAIRCTKDGDPVTLTGSVLLRFLRDDGVTVDVPGSVVDGAAVATLSGNCYAVMGRAEITIFVTQDSATVAVYSANTAVTRTTSGEEISGGDIINLPELQERFEDMADAIEDCEAATAAAEGITDMIAPVESTSTASQAYAVGEYLIYNGTLYEVTAPIASGDTLTVGTNIAAVTTGFGGEVTDLKNAVTDCFDIDVSPNLFDSNAVVSGYIANATGGISITGDWKTSDFIPVEYGATYTYSVTAVSTGVRAKETIFFRVEYDANKAVIANTYTTSGTQGYTPVSQSAKYLRFSIHWVDSHSNRTFQKGISIDYTPFGQKSYTLKSEANTESVTELLTASTVVNSRNLFDKNAVVPGYISNATGSISITGDWKTTNYIPVEYGVNYRCSNDTGNMGVYFALELDEDFAPVNYVNTASNPYTPSAQTVKFLRFSQHEANIATMVFEKGAQASCIYTPFGYDLLASYRTLLYGKKWVAIGDSLTEKNVSAISNYTDFILVKNNMEFVNMGVGGTGYMRGYDSDSAFYQRAENVPDCDIVTIFGSGNDLAYYSSLGDVTDTTTDTICGCMNKTLDVIFENHPTTPLLVIAPTPWAGNTPDMTIGMALYCEKLAAICARRGVAYLDLFHHSGLRPDDDDQKDLVFYDGSLDGHGDYVHPNKLGHQIIAPRIMQAMESIMMF